MRSVIGCCCAFAVVLAGWAGVAWAVDPPDTQQAVAELKAEFPQARLAWTGGRITQVSGQPLTTGTSPEVSAELFRLDHAAAFGVDAGDLMSVGLRSAEPGAQPVMYDAETGQFKFTLVRYGQFKDGIAVFGSDLRVLIANLPEYPVVLANSSLRPLGDFVPMVEVDPSAAELAKAAALEIVPGLVNFTEAETFIWAGVNDEVVEPVVALVFVGDNYGSPDAEAPQKWLFVADATTGQIKYSEDQIIFTDVVGNVSGKETPGPKAMQCTASALSAFPYAYVNLSAGPSDYADENGDFVIPYSGGLSVTVYSYIRGQYFRVYNSAGSDEQLSQSVTPPGPANFIHNQADTSEFVRAQANGYVDANEVRGWTLTQNPYYPVVSTDLDFPVYVNRSDGYCPGNAWYDGASINFCLSASGYANTAFASVVQHEYGHHLVQSGGSGQGAYGEGMSDCVSMLIADDPKLGVGFYLTDCNNGIRTGDNDFQYPCTGEIHECGQLLSGCVWSTRNELIVTEPADYLSILSNLTVNSILMHGGETIAPSICTDFLTLDDDNGDLSDGTPHFEEITTGFGAHSMYAGPPPENDSCAGALRACPGESYSGNTVSATNDGSSSCGDSSGSPDLWYVYRPATSGSATFSLCSGTGYDSVLSVHTGCPGLPGNEVGCDDDGCGSGGGPSTVTASVSAGVSYYIRVTGWSGAAGTFTLQVTGPVCAAGVLDITFPDGLPVALEPGVPNSFNVLIEDGDEAYVPGTGRLRYRYSGGTYLSVPLTSLGGGLHQATLPPAGCDDNPEFYISAQGDGGGMAYSPYDAPTSVHTAVMGTITVHIDDAFETDQGWTVGDTGDDATTGTWGRTDPLPTAAQPGDDHTLDPGTMCWVTDGRGGSLGDYDVDGGKTTVKSPVMNLSGVADATVSYFRWYSNNTGATPGTDVFVVSISNNGGTSWTTVETVGPSGAGTTGGWYYHEFQVADFVTPTAQVRMRFVASDEGDGSLVEAAVDDFLVTSFECLPPAECVATGAASCRDHAAAGRLCVDLGSSSGIESRLGGATELEVTVDDAAGFGGGVTVTCVNAGDVSGSVSGTSVNGDTVTVTFAPALPDQDACTVELDCGASVCVRGLAGDVDVSGLVTPGDASIIKPHFGAVPDASLVRFDIDASGLITPGDFSQVKPTFGHAAPACP